jgi:hypothetical protein
LKSRIEGSNPSGSASINYFYGANAER